MVPSDSSFFGGGGDPKKLRSLSGGNQSGLSKRSKKYRTCPMRVSSATAADTCSGVGSFQDDIELLNRRVEASDHRKQSPFKETEFLHEFFMRNDPNGSALNVGFFHEPLRHLN